MAFYITGIVAVVAEAHDAERRRHGALAGSQYRADQQDLGFPPGRVAKQRGEGIEYGYNRVGQGEHRLAFFQEGPASLPCSYDLPSFCTKSSSEFAETKGTAREVINLAVGVNNEEVTVVAQDGTTQIYTISITRPPATVILLASNTQQNFNVFYGPRGDIVAQSFTTGSNTGGYWVHAVDILLGTANTGNHTGDTYVTLNQDDSGDPGTKIVNFSNPDQFSNYGLNTFVADTSIRLAPDTTYWVVVNESSSAKLLTRLTDENEEDFRSQAGWSIGNGRKGKATPSSSWQDIDTLTDYSLMIAIRGSLYVTSSDSLLILQPQIILIG